MAFQGWLRHALARLRAGPPRTEAAGESSRSAPDAAPPREARILIAEDHAVNRFMLQSLLHALGFRADEAADGNEALEACRARAYDLVLMDCHMPNLDGFECARRIRALGGPRPVIVGITAEALAQTRGHCLEAGMDQVLPKPVEEDALRKILAPWKASGENSVTGDRKTADPSPDLLQWVDVARLVGLMENTRLRDPEYRMRAFAQFRNEALFLRSSLCEAGAAGKARELKAAAHGLQGLSLTMGLNRLAETCRRIEAASASGTSPDWSPALADFETAFEPSLAALSRALRIAPDPRP